MTAPTAAPHHILLATDLGSRCDRALDRALQSARQWQARLVALTVVEPGAEASPYPVPPRIGGASSGSSARALAERRLRTDLADEEMPPAVRVEQGPVADTILAVAAAEGSELIVTGVARNESLSRIVLGSAVDALARRSPVPLLVVRSRPRTPYRRVTVAVDFSPSSRRALETAAALFPEAEATLFHAFDTPYPARAGVDRAQALDTGHELARREAETFLQGSVLPDGWRARMQMSLQHGDAALLMHERSLARPDELVVVGTQRRGALIGLLIGSVAQRILELSEGDVLVVPRPEA